MHPGQIEIQDSAADRWRAAEILLSLPPDLQIMRDGDIAWLNPLPTFEWYQEFYNNGYYGAETGKELDLNRFAGRRVDYFSRRIQRIAGRLGRRPRSILEVGSGDGCFLQAAKQAGIEAHGTEISVSASEKAVRRYGVEVLLGDLIRSDLPLRPPYDVVVMNHVLEHLLTPMHYLERVRDLLAPGGILAIEIPQQFINPVDLTYRALGVRRRFTAYSMHHPYFYTVSSVRRLLGAAGYRIEHLTTWLPGQVFHIQAPAITVPVQAVLWAADRIARRGHIIEICARPR